MRGKSRIFRLPDGSLILTAQLNFKKLSNVKKTWILILQVRNWTLIELGREKLCLNSYCPYPHLFTSGLFSGSYVNTINKTND